SFHQLNITLRNEVPLDQRFDLIITYDLDSIVLEEEYYYFEYYSTINYFTENYYLEFLLPEECLTHYWEDKTSVYPEPGFQGFDHKLNRMVLSWSFTDLVATSNQLFFIYFDPPITNHLIWAYIISIFLGILIGIIGTYWFLNRRVKNTAKEIGGLFLNESQKILLKTILEKEGRISQSDLCRKTGFSRSKTSRNLISLEEQGFIIKERWGKNAIIEITKTGKQVIE
ncbi:MAG: winged helix-turn-helix transcriptional regulator, partial [Asgard group archaeon]|nr:winged helix-turn-helix transcriptional regulator [Asgard group archaeon]